MRYNKKVAAVVLVVIAVAAFVLYTIGRRDRLARAMPAWLDPQQPPTGVAGQLSTLSDAQSWAANRCTPMSACCAGNTAGARVRRTYAPNLAESTGSFIRGRVGLELGTC